MIQLQVKNEYAKEYLAFLAQKKKPLFEQIKSIQEEIAEIDNQISQLNASINGRTQTTASVQLTAPLNVDGYSKNSTWAKKAEFILRQANKSITTNEIIDELIKIEPELNRKTALASISSILSVKSREVGSIFKRKENDNGEWLYDVGE